MHESLLHIEHVARLTHVQDRDSTHTVLAEVLQSLLRSQSVNLLEVVDCSGQLHCLVRAHLTPDLVAPTSTPPWVSPEDCPLLASYPQRQASVQSGQTQVHDDGAVTVVTVPVITEAETVQLIEVHMPLGQPPLAQALIEGLARIYRNFLNLIDYSERDSLTSLLNRKSFDDAFFKATRYRSPSAAAAPDGGQRQPHQAAQYWLGVIDIDHFKRVNDGYGHLIGDEVLLLMARIMRSSFRHEDRLYRFGGEEFVVLLRAAEDADAGGVFERFRHNVESYEFPQVGRLTVSIGYTRMRDNDSPSAAFERADKVVYLAKERGRNRVYCFEEQNPAAGFENAVIDNDIELF